MYKQPVLPGDVAPPPRPIPRPNAVAPRAGILPTLQPVLAQRRFPAFLLLIIVPLLVLLAGFTALKHWPSLILEEDKHASAASSAPAPQRAPAAIPMSEAEDLLKHLENAIGNSLKASGEMKRSQEWVERVIPSVETNYMAMEKRRLQTARTAAESARRYAEQAREELEIAKNLLMERSK